MEPERLPRVSIITPSYNQAPFLEETILSVLSQDYPNVEYIIIDGGSTDGSIDIIKRYENRLAYWVSEPDRGQSHAINKGWQRASGDIVAYLNSDDLYTPAAIATAVHALVSNPEACMVYSDALRISGSGRPLGSYRSGPFDVRRVMTSEVPILQPTVFIRRSALDEAGLLDEHLHFVMDYELWIRLGLHHPAVYLPATQLARVREHEAAKSTAAVERFIPEQRQVLDRVFSRPDLPDAVRQYRGAAYASLSFWEAMHAARAGQPGQTRRALRRAFSECPAYVARRPFTVFLVARAVLPWWTGRPTADEWRVIDRAWQNLTR
jgi:glycosyltransferase involved in cell wall biosynthesis